MFKSFRKFVPVFIFLFLPLLLVAQETREFYQLKIYNFDDDSQTRATEEFLQNAYLPALKRQNLGEIGVFKPKADSLNQLYVLIPFSSLEQLSNLDEELQKDVLYLENGSEYLTAPAANPPYNRIQAIVMTAFKDMPVMKPSSLTSPRDERVYELRSYQAATEAYLRNKIDMFNEGGEIILFDDLGFNAVFYGEVVAGPHMPNLMYLTTFKDQESRDKHWQEFGNSPVWKELAAQPQYKNNVSHIDIHFLYPTEYSDY